MSELNRIIKYMIPYWGKGLLSILLSLLSTVFSLFSFTLAAPFLGILFNNQPIVTETIPFELTTEAIKQNFNYFLSQII
ncbi:MAG: hypothetical protein KAQ75_02485, partial [Bacteroidales bacterium]|nr:hypothetical protein [Bacteroidales bacterium]